MSDRAEQANAYMRERMGFDTRMFQVINTIAPEVGERFSDFYESIWADGNLSRKFKELSDDVEKEKLKLVSEGYDLEEKDMS